MSIRKLINKIRVRLVGMSLDFATIDKTSNLIANIYKLEARIVGKYMVKEMGAIQAIRQLIYCHYKPFQALGALFSLNKPKGS